MRPIAALLAFGFAALLAAVSAVAQTTKTEENFCQDQNPRTLKVALYPYIPNFTDAAFTIKETFEAGCKGLQLEIITGKLLDQYYSTKPDQDGAAPKNIFSTQADVYEVDSVFFDDFVGARKVQPIPQATINAVGAIVPMAQNIRLNKDTVYGVPHWLCTEFLIYRKDHPEIGSIKTFSELKRVFGTSGNRLLMDLKGTSTLGEEYLSAIIARYGIDDWKNHLKSVDADAMQVLRDILSLEPTDFGRDSDYHYRNGFYQIQFARGAGSAFVGYSETTNYTLSELQQSCKHNECLNATDLEVTALPYSETGSHPVAWVDMYMIDASVKGTTLRDAQAFIAFMMKKSTYVNLLLPKDQPPRYLMPARDDVWNDPGIVANAPLYAKFRPIIDTATAVTLPNLNTVLRDRGSEIDGQLPSKH